MKKQKLLLTCILKDDSEYAMAERMLDSFMPYYDGLAVCLNGLSGKYTKLKKLIKKHGGEYIEITPQSHPKVYSKEEDGKWRFVSFAEARNASFELAAKMQEKENYDWWSWADVDDVLLHGEQLQDVAKKAKKAGMDEILFTYWYSVKVKPDGTFDEHDVVIDHVRERLLRPNVFKWISRLHEIAVPIDGNYKPKYAPYSFNREENQLCVWTHLTTETRVDKALERNAEILEIQVREEQRKDPRTLFYLAKVYADMKDPIKNTLAQELIKEYLQLSGWPEERSNAWELLGSLALRRKDTRKAIDFFHSAQREYPPRHMPYLLLAREYANVGDTEKADFYLDLVLNMPKPVSRTTIGNPFDIKMMAAGLAYNRAIRNNDIEGAIEWLKRRGQMMGNVDKEAIKILEDAKLYNDAGIWFHNLAKYLKDTGEPEKVDHLLKAVPKDMQQEPFIHIIAQELKKPKKWGKKEIAYMASGGGPAFEQWGPGSLKRGVGGSERAVIELSRAWVKKGYKVTVYGDPQDEAGEHEGVEYRPWYEFNWNDTFNILILWRSPHLMDREIKAKKIFMDLHDVASQIDWTDERMKKIDKIFFKSKYHRDMVPKLPEEKAVIISNGI
ncbi:MAG: hypothetical protein KDH96_08050 [Candidatus Riesia sp.]|nr:hypothetical protein [Candidatus Riesia sp.]